MESDKHAFMRKLLVLCIEMGVGFYTEQICDAVGRLWIDSVDIHIANKKIIGYWDGERHEVSL